MSLLEFKQKHQERRKERRSRIKEKMTAAREAKKAAGKHYWGKAKEKKQSALPSVTGMKIPQGTGTKLEG